MNYYSNHQWSVTSEGIEFVPPNPGYIIEKDRLDEMVDRGAGQQYDWPVHVAEKTWVDIEAFIAAFEQALVIHKSAYKSSIDDKVLKDSLSEARITAREK